MDFHIPAFSFIYYASLVICIITSAVVYRRRPAPGALPFAWFVGSGAVWSFFWILELSSVNLADKIIWAKLEYLGIVSTGVLWLFFVLDYTGRIWWRKPRNILLLGAIPLVTLAVVWTNEWHHLFWSNIYIAQGNFGDIAIWEKGPWFSIFVVYQYSLISAGIILLLKSRLVKTRLYYKQIGFLILGVSLPIIINLIYLLKVPALAGLDLTPVGLAIANIAFTFGIYRYNLMNITAVARNTLVEHMPAGIIVTDIDGRIVDVNQALLRMKGISKKGTLGKRLIEVWPELADLLCNRKVRDQHALIYEAGEPERYLDFNVTSLFDKHNKLGGTMLVLRDVTESKSTQKKLETMYEKEKVLSQNLKEEIDNRSKYTRALVHELKTPLTAILSSGEILEAEIEDATLKQAVKNIRKASANLEYRANELLDLACGEIGILSVEHEPLDFVMLIKRVSREIVPLIKAKNLELKLELGKIPLIKGDEKRLMMVLANLLGNAIKYTEQGCITIRAMDFDSERLLVQLKDTGRGIDLTQMENIFDPYRRKSTEGQKYGGIGVGLALAKLYVELHNGKIWVESIPGKGTTFFFTLPVYVNAPSNAESSTCRTSGLSF